MWWEVENLSNFCSLRVEGWQEKAIPFFNPQFFIPEALFSPSLTTVHQHKESRSGGQEMPNPVKITEDSNMVFSKTMQIYGKDFKKPNIEAKKIEAILTDRFNSTKFF